MLRCGVGLRGGERVIEVVLKLVGRERRQDGQYLVRVMRRERAETHWLPNKVAHAALSAKVGILTVPITMRVVIHALRALRRIAVHGVLLLQAVLAVLWARQSVGRVSECAKANRGYGLLTRSIA